MTLLKKIVLHPAAALITLIPFVNLAYFVLFIVFAPTSKLPPCMFGITIGSAAAFWLSNQIVPEGTELLKLCAIMTLLSIASYLLLRTFLKSETQFPKTAKVRLVAGAALILIVGVTWSLSSSIDLQPQTETMLQAIIDEDEEAFRSVSYGDSLKLQSVLKKLENQGIDLRGEIHLVATHKREVRGQKDDQMKFVDYTYRIGNDLYLVKVTYRSAYEKEGISGLEISKK